MNPLLPEETALQEIPRITIFKNRSKVNLALL